MAGRLIDRLVQACLLFEAQRLPPFLERWRLFDPLPGQPVRVVRGDRTLDGVYRGIAATGALLLDGDGGVSEHHAGEVSLRRDDRA